MPVSKNRRKNKKKPSAATGSSSGLTLVASSPEPDSSPPEPLSQIPDIHAIEGVMAQFGGGLFSAGGDDGDDDVLWQAQQIMYDAWETGSKRQRISLAKKALAVSEYCADAYVLLAEEAAKTIVEARAYYEQGVAAGEKALGPEIFELDVGHFWGLLETRPYMRARAGLADCLWGLGEREVAIAHLWDMLRLNPGDNQGMRSVLLSRLFAIDDLDGAEKILTDYREDILADWSYAKTLLLFKQQGPSAAATKALKAAVKNNPFVPDMLLGAKPMPKTLPPHYGLGSKDEAVLYVFSNRENWSATKGAIQWLAKITTNIRPKPKRAR